MKYSNQEVFDEIMRELGMRKRVYPRHTKRDMAHKDYLDPHEARRRIEIMQQIADEYDPQSMFNKKFRFSEWLTQSGWLIHSMSEADGWYKFTSGDSVLTILSSGYGFIFNIKGPDRHPMTGIPIPENERQARLLIHTLIPKST